MTIQQLGYTGLHSTDPAAFDAYATRILGLQKVATDTGRPAFRMDSFEQRLIVEPSNTDGGAYYGWQVGSADELRAAADRVERAGVPVTAATAEELEVRRVRQMVHFLDPSGHRVELYTGPSTTHDAFHSPRGLKGFVGDDLGFGHVVLTTRNLAATQRFYQDVLGFRLSDYMVDSPFSASFLHVNERHHSLALVDGSFFNAPDVLHHFMLEVTDPDEVGRSWDLVQQEGVPITMSLGKHTNDEMFSFYTESPVGVHTEFGSGGRLVDDATWQVCQIPGPDVWGHRH